MKLTPIDIQQHQFRKTLRGFDPREVANFLELIGQQLGELSRENSELKAEQRRTKRELDEHRDQEHTLKEAMLTAQGAIAEIREQAQKEAQLTLTDAELRAGAFGLRRAQEGDRDAGQHPRLEATTSAGHRRASSGAQLPSEVDQLVRRGRESDEGRQ